ncbi:MAG TPA: LuxR C-terminal-related transcriptional regulator, partial [Acidimicrobiia bacterium]|nr:LuxR C-terminal-related transcriptional regulator [Acidimicrobiia bacterium]
GTTTALEHLHVTFNALDAPLGRSFADAASAVDAELSLLAGDGDRAARRVATLPVGVERELLAAGVELARGDTRAVRARLDALRPISLVHCVRAELLHAAAAEDIVEQRRHVAVAARLAAPEGLRRRFVESAPVVARAARSLVSSTELEPLTREFLDSIADLPVVSPEPMLIEPLTERERSVLRYLTTPLEYRDIAAELLISQNTLKTHVTSIHRKLGATSRAQAVSEAERLGLLRRA